jgi:hypothetical protein
VETKLEIAIRRGIFNNVSTFLTERSDEQFRTPRTRDSSSCRHVVDQHGLGRSVKHPRPESYDPGLGSIWKRV